MYSHTQSVLTWSSLCHYFINILLILLVSPELVKKEDNMYMEMKSTINDTTLLTDHVDDLGDDEYIRVSYFSSKYIQTSIFHCNFFN